MEKLHDDYTINCQGTSNSINNLNITNTRATYGYVPSFKLLINFVRDR